MKNILHYKQKNILKSIKKYFEKKHKKLCIKKNILQLLKNVFKTDNIFKIDMKLFTVHMKKFSTHIKHIFQTLWESFYSTCKKGHGIYKIDLSL